MTTVTEALSAFDLANRADGLSEKTAVNYRYLLDESHHSLVAWLRHEQADDELSSITTDMLRRHVVWLRGRTHMQTGQPLAEQTVNDYVRALHRFFRWCAHEYDQANPMERISYPRHRPSPRQKAIELRDVGKLLAACDQTTDKGVRDRAIIAFLIDTGARAGGVCRLRREDLNLVERTAIVREKGNKSRLVCFTRRTAELLRQWMMRRFRGAATFFHTMRNPEPLTVNGLRQTLKKIGAKCDVRRCNPHAFRHAFAKAYLDAGGELVTLALLLGHQQVTTTAEYYTIFTQREVADKHERFSPMNRIAA